MRQIMIAMVMVGVAICTAASVTACDTRTETTGSQASTTTRATTPTARGTPTNAPPPTATTAPPAVPTTSRAAGAETGASAGCAQTREWATNQRAATPATTDALYLVRAGRHGCYDRVVLDINGPAEVGYLVRYVPVVTADGSGARVPVAGGAALEVVVRAPIQGFDSGGHQPWRVLAVPGDHFYTSAQLAGWRSLRAVRFAGTFEGQSSLALGVRETLPFRVFALLDASNQVRRLVIDVAHQR